MIHLVVDARAIRPGATGVGHYAAGVLRGFDAIGSCEVTAVRIASEAHAFGWLGDFWRGLRHIRVVDVDADYENHPRGDIWLHGHGMDRVIRSVEGDALLSPAFVCPIGRRSYARVLVVQDTFAWDIPENYPWKFAAYLRAATAFSARSADAVATTSPHVRRRMNALRIGAGRRIEIVPPGVDHAVFNAAPPRKTEGLPPLIACPGSFEPRKNCRVLFEAMRREPLASVGARLLLIHDGHCEDLPEDIDVQVVAPRTQEHMSLLLRLAGAVALPSRAEGFGLSLIEAMACGRPIVASDIPPFRWMSGNGKCAALVPPDEAGRWANALASALRAQDSTDAGRRANAVKRAASFTWERTARRLARIAEEVRC